eukprot:scaffold22976_cov35-Attheya_sp.AAC.1
MFNVGVYCNAPLADQSTQTVRAANPNRTSINMLGYDADVDVHLLQIVTDMAALLRTIEFVKYDLKSLMDQLQMSDDIHQRVGLHIRMVQSVGDWRMAMLTSRSARVGVAEGTRKAGLAGCQCGI